jgi:hypothetical protein
MTMDNWNELLVKAQPLIDFLGRPDYFDRAYSGDRNESLVIADASLGMEYATDDSFDKFDEWQTVSDSPSVFPDEFEWKRWIDHNLQKNNYFDLSEKNFHGADSKWTDEGACLLVELMHRDIRILLHCYANDHFPEIWKKIQATYFLDGFPCGWDGNLPSGKLVVFSNE